jgi:cell division protein ZapB
MPFSKHSKGGSQKRVRVNEPRDYAQLGLDFSATDKYSHAPRKEKETMNHELFETLENKVSDLLEKYKALKDENNRLDEENQRLQSEREILKSRVDAILGKLDGI